MSHGRKFSCECLACALNACIEIVGAFYESDKLFRIEVDLVTLLAFDDGRSWEMEEGLEFAQYRQQPIFGDFKNAFEFCERNSTR